MIEDVGSLLHSTQFVENKEIKEAFCEQVERTLEQVSIKGEAGARILLTPPGRVAIEELGGGEGGEGGEEEEEESKEGSTRGKVQYYDENSNKYEVDMMGMEARKVEQGEADEGGFAGEFRPALNGALKKYMQIKFHEGAGRAAAFVFNNPPCA